MPENKAGKNSKPAVERDAKGQFVRTEHGKSNDGVSGANPRVLSGNEDGDSTFPLKRRKKKS
jgi:hypothetical protein